MATISLILPTRNGKHFLAPCLASIARQTRPPDEVIIVDNGSGDGTQAWLQEQHPQIKLIEIDRNAGFSVAVNRGIEAGSGDYIALLNNDTECDPQWLEALAGILDQYPDVGFCASKIRYFDKRQLIDTVGDAFTTGGFAFKRGWLQIDEGQYAKPERVFGACAGAAMYRKRMLDDIGKFDEDFFAYQEDADLNFRAQLAGYHCLFVPKAMVFHHVGGTSKTTGYDRWIRLGQRNLIFVLVKNLPVGLWFRFGIPILLSQTCLFAMRVYGGYGVAVLKGLWDAFAQLRPILRKRRAIQRSRRVSNGYLISVMDSHWIRILFDPFIRKRMLKRQNIKV